MAKYEAVFQKTKYQNGYYWDPLDNIIVAVMFYLLFGITTVMAIRSYLSIRIPDDLTTITISEYQFEVSDEHDIQIVTLAQTFEISESMVVNADPLMEDLTAQNDLQITYSTSHPVRIWGLRNSTGVTYTTPSDVFAARRKNDGQVILVLLLIGIAGIALFALIFYVGPRTSEHPVLARLLFRKW